MLCRRLLNLFRKLFLATPLLFYIAFVDVFDWTRLLALGVFLAILVFSRKLRVIALPTAIGLLIATAVFSDLSWSWSIGTLFSFLILLFWNETYAEPKHLLFYASLSWMILLGFFGGFLAVPLVLVFLSVCFLFAKRWVAFLPVVLLLVLPLYAPDFFSGFDFVGYSGQTDVSEEYREPAEQEDTPAHQRGAGAGTANQGSLEQDEYGQQMLRILLDLSFVIIGIMFVFIGIRLLLGLRRMNKRTLIAMIKSLMILGGFLAAVYLFLQIPPSPDFSEMHISSPGGGIPIVGTPQAPQDPGSPAPQETVVDSERGYSLPIGLVGALVLFVASIVFAVLALRWLLGYSRRKQSTEKLSESPEEGLHQEEGQLLSERGAALVKRIYVTIRKKLFPGQDHLTPLELVSAKSSAAFRRLTEEFVSIEYGFSSPRSSDEELRQMMNDTISSFGLDDPPEKL